MFSVFIHIFISQPPLNICCNDHQISVNNHTPIASFTMNIFVHIPVNTSKYFVNKNRHRNRKKMNKLQHSLNGNIKFLLQVTGCYNWNPHHKNMMNEGILQKVHENKYTFIESFFKELGINIIGDDIKKLYTSRYYKVTDSLRYLFASKGVFISIVKSLYFWTKSKEFYKSGAIDKRPNQHCLLYMEHFLKRVKLLFNKEKEISDTIYNTVKSLSLPRTHFAFERKLNEVQETTILSECQKFYTPRPESIIVKFDEAKLRKEFYQKVELREIDIVAPVKGVYENSYNFFKKYT